MILELLGAIWPFKEKEKKPCSLTVRLSSWTFLDEAWSRRSCASQTRPSPGPVRPVGDRRNRMLILPNSAEAAA